jgi:polyhydroxyalkanoate synthesis regulator phasin
MVEKPQGTDKPADTTTTTATTTPVAGAATVTPPRRPGHRGADVRDTVAEMAARAQEISLEAGSKIAAAMKDVIGAAAGLTGFALESARDLVQYMVRRGQMTQDEADKLIRDVEESQGTRRPTAPARPPQPRADLIRSEPTRPDSARPDSDGKKHAPVASVAAPSRPAAQPASRPAAKTRPPARPAKKASPARARRAAGARRPKPTAAKKGAAKAKKKKR